MRRDEVPNEYQVVDHFGFDPISGRAFVGSEALPVVRVHRSERGLVRLHEMPSSLVKLVDSAMSGENLFKRSSQTTPHTYTRCCVRFGRQAGS